MELRIELKDCLEATNEALAVSRHPWFHALRSGNVTKDEFLRTQIEFSHLVQFFNRPMAVVIANIHDATKRMAIVENLWEEHGKGNPDKVHGRTILTLIDRLGGTSATIDRSSLTDNVRAFNNALRSVAAFESYRYACAVFAGIERSFVDISSELCQSIIDNGWLTEDRITHYALHKQIDIEHAQDFLKVANEDWETPFYRDEIQEGLRFGGRLFLNVYTNFYIEWQRDREAVPDSKLAKLG